nr:immunoglobulin heavy chain junction region [Macaca mulatta]MOY21808.1 immunoglobulin heavy chain junction region [Macaca mulatta]MOY22538.1 immunoglobulin heavy chain junction region [Macaca mulatta]MOY26880.1 immunoglobulin heavy chain junction region [Macaca mulatta]MOY27272.1 immunoglobulin heavy chain junction region [Macaca mulatta]
CAKVAYASSLQWG